MSNSTVDPKVQSIRTKLANLGRSLGVDYPRVYTLFLLERAAYRLLQDSVLAKSLVFKGGFVSVRVYRSPRYTTDLDALVRGLTKEEAVARVSTAMATEAGDGCWFQLEESLDLTTQGEYGGIRLAHRGGLGNRPLPLTRAQLVNIDLGIGDPVTPSPVSLQTDLTLGEGSLSWQVYPAATILAEKIHALITIGARNSRSKDIFDIALLLPQAERDTVAAAMVATFNFRGDPIPASVAATLSTLERTQLRLGWSAAVKSAKEKRSFDEVFDEIIAMLQHWKL